ncbi:hypothetical protein EC973_000871 [Apophysomyces ossiformis]|uniref:Uncharacterized protein n=1 Tax=Apophysomyces ossiformis TaxID=679940 RepID=A0A8H7BQ54_9FUNG|nr:hypothetical protein EC973_000871 [Apophysomyces ossiformis]
MFMVINSDLLLQSDPYEKEIDALSSLNRYLGQKSRPASISALSELIDRGQENDIKSTAMGNGKWKKSPANRSWNNEEEPKDAYLLAGSANTQCSSSTQETKTDSPPMRNFYPQDHATYEKTLMRYNNSAERAKLEPRPYP